MVLVVLLILLNRISIGLLKTQEFNKKKELDSLKMMKSNLKCFATINWTTTQEQNWINKLF